MDIIQAPQKRHARFHQSGTPYHIISKTAGGALLLVPKPGIRELCAGVLARAQKNYPGIKLYGYAFMSNHIHLIISGTSVSIADFMAFTKREISRRIGVKYNLKGPKWEKPYTSTALPTPESQDKCLKYILSQGVKENLVAHPFHWPGLHCAKALSTGNATQGQWFNATAYKKKKREQKLRLSPQKVKKADYYESLSVELSVFSHWKSLSKAQVQARIEKFIDEIVAEAKHVRIKTKTRILGVKKVVQASISQRVAAPNPPWWRERRRQITAWASPNHSKTRDYLDLYYQFQKAFRLASTKLKNGLDAVFPRESWMPVRYFASPSG